MQVLFRCVANVAGTIVGALSLEMLWDYIQLAKGSCYQNILSTQHHSFRFVVFVSV